MYNSFHIDSSLPMATASHYSHHQLHLHPQHQYVPQSEHQQHSLNATNPSTPSSSSASVSTVQDGNSASSGSSSTSRSPTTVLRSKPAYGTGDMDDGYTLSFANMEEFQSWRAREEEDKVVEFVKGDTHGSKAVPPRFKDHTKLVCARHTRSGRKKYVKKYPDRQRKLPSRKIEGEGCPASISYKTFFHTEEVRACYNDKHSHEVGEANLMFTRRGRKLAQEKNKLNTLRSVSVTSSLGQAPTPDSTTIPTPSTATTATNPQNGIISSSSHTLSPTLQQQQCSLPSHPNLPSHIIPSSVLSLLAPLSQASASGPMSAVLPPHSPPLDVSQERWDRMAVLFASIRQHARAFEYPSPSVVALESVLIRLYLESPIGGNLGPTLGADR